MAGLEIHDAAATGDYDTLEECVKSGKFDVNLKDVEWNNRTALHWACAKGYVECIRLLLDNGAKGTARTDTGWTPAHCAAETGKLTSLRALNNAGVPVDLKDRYGDRPRAITEVYGHKECAKFLFLAEIEWADKRLRLDNIEGSDYESEADTEGS
ncbi:ankyrin repeat domain-containing protein 66-like isoform X2 [Liolophura sinensis]